MLLGDWGNTLKQTPCISGGYSDGCIYLKVLYEVEATISFRMKQALSHEVEALECINWEMRNCKIMEVLFAKKNWPRVSPQKIFCLHRYELTVHEKKNEISIKIWRLVMRV